MSYKQAIAQPSADNPVEQLVHWVRYGDTDKVKGVLTRHQEGALDWKLNVNQIDKHGRSLVMLAAKRGFHEILQLLITQKANLEVRDNNDNRAIHYAAMGGHKQCSELLVQAGAQLCHENKFGRRIDVLAKKNGFGDLAQYFNESGCYADVEEDSEPEPEEVKEGDESPKLPETCRRLLKDSAGLALRLDAKAPLPQPQAGEVLVRVHAVVLTAQDADIYEAASVSAKLPFTPGSGGVAGVVVGLGEGVADSHKIGTRVSVEPLLFAGNCVFDQENDTGSIPRFGTGQGTDAGFLAGYISVPAKYAFPVVSNLTYSQAALLPLLGEAFRVMRFASCPAMPKILQEQALVISGCNPLALAMVALAKRAGATKIIVVDDRTASVTCASTVGAHAVMSVQKLLGDGLEMGMLVDTSGQVEVVQALLPSVRRGGRVVLARSFEQPLQLPADVVERNLTLKTVWGRKIWSTWQAAEKLFQGDQALDVESLISHEVMMSQYEDAFALLLSGIGGVVVVNPQH